MSSLSHQGKVIAIVGGTTGLGLSAARALVAAGANVAICGRTQGSLDAALAELGDAAIGLCGDATESATSEALIDLAVEKFASLSGLYHVAGGSGRSRGDGALHEMTDEGWRFTLDLNLTSLAFSNRAAVRQFLKQGSGGGTILNMGSVLGFSPSPEHFSSHAYAAAKSAVIGFAQSIASRYASDNIRANVIAPALVETPMSERAQQSSAILDFVARKQRLDGGRIGRPEDLDAAVLFLLGDGARYVTGQIIAVDGGWSVS